MTYFSRSAHKKYKKELETMRKKLLINKNIKKKVNELKAMKVKLVEITPKENVEIEKQDLSRRS